MGERKAEQPSQASALAGSADVSQLVCLLSRCIERPVEQIHPSMRLGPDLGVDSLGLMDFVMAIETELEVFVDESQVSKDLTLEQLASVITQSRGSNRELYRWEWPLSRGIRLSRDAAHTFMLFPALRVWVPSKVVGKEHLRDLEGPVLFASNHLSLIDTPVILAALPRRWCLRIATLAATHVLFGRGRIAVLLASFWFNAFPFSQNPPIRPSFEHCSSLVNRGWSILMYPEGRRSDTGQMGPFKPGVGLLAAKLGVPVVPVRVSGTKEVMPNGRAIPRRGCVEVRFGEPLRVSPEFSYLQAASTIEKAVNTLGQDNAIKP